MEWILFDASKRSDSISLNSNNAAVEPRQINNPLHPNFGSYVLLKSIIDSPGYQRWQGQFRALQVLNAEPEQLFTVLSDLS